MPEGDAILIAFENRLDLRAVHGEVFDAQRNVVVTADALQMGLDLTGTASAGELPGSGGPDGNLRFSEGAYSAGLDLDLPWERTAQRNNYRAALISLEAAVRSAQQAEDQIKSEIRNGLRQLMQQRQSFIIQLESVRVAQRRVARTRELQALGREGATVRDINEGPVGVARRAEQPDQRDNQLQGR